MISSGMAWNEEEMWAEKNRNSLVAIKLFLQQYATTNALIMMMMMMMVGHYSDRAGGAKSYRYRRRVCGSSLYSAKEEMNMSS